MENSVIYLSLLLNVLLIFGLAVSFKNNKNKKQKHYDKRAIN